MRRLKISLDNNRLIQGGPFEVGNQVLISSHRKLLLSKAMVVLCQEGVRAPCCMRDEGRPFGAAL
jgi:hypothetical protein